MWILKIKISKIGRKKKRHRNWLAPTVIKSASMIRETPGRLGEFP